VGSAARLCRADFSAVARVAEGRLHLAAINNLAPDDGIDAGAAIDPSGIADDVDQPIDRMQPPKQIVVLAIGAREKRREVAETDALERRNAVDAR